jgi:hypothetical protein
VLSLEKVTGNSTDNKKQDITGKEGISGSVTTPNKNVHYYFQPTHKLNQIMASKQYYVNCKGKYKHNTEPSANEIQ